MYILHLESSTKVCSVALSCDGELVQLSETNSDQYIHGEKLTLFIEEVLAKEKIKVKDLKAVSIASGPGSYTGLRIGVSVAKGLCFGLSIPLIAVDSLHVIHELAREKYPNKTIIPMIDARRMEVFTTIYDESGMKLNDISATIIEENTFHEYEPFIACGDGAEKLSQLWENRNLIIDNEVLSSAKGQVKSVFSAFKAQKFENIAYFEPFYLKDFVSTQKK